MNTKSEQPKVSVPQAAETQYYGGVSLNKSKSANPQGQTNFNFQSPADQSTSQQLAPGQNPVQSEQKPPNRPQNIHTQQRVAPAKVEKKIEAKPRTLLYVGFAAATFVVVVIAVTLLVFSVTSKNVNAAPYQVDVLPASDQSTTVELPAAGEPAGISLNIAGQLTEATPTPAEVPTQVIDTAPVQPYEPPVIGQGGTCIAGSVIDINHNLIPADLNIRLAPKAGGEPLNLKVDSSGHFRFSNLAAGTYNVDVEVRKSWVAITASNFDVILNGSSSDCAEVRAKFELPGCFIVSALNYDKTNRIVGLPERTIIITNGAEKISKKTDMYGRAVFPDLLKGNWIIAEELNEGWAPVRTIINKEENNSLISSFLYEPFYEPTIVEPLKRYQRQPAQEIILQKQTKQNWWRLPIQLAESFDGNNRNIFSLQVEPAPYPQKNQDPAFCQPIPIVDEQVKGSVFIKKLEVTDKGEIPASGWTMKLHNSRGTQPSPDDKVTGSDGTACFPNLELEEWTTSEVPQYDWEQIIAPINPLNLTTRWDCATLKYKNMTQVFKNSPIVKQQFCSIDGYKINDLEQPLAGWTIQATNTDTNKSSASVMTDINGYFKIDGLSPGNWKVFETAKTDWKPVTPDTLYVNLDFNKDGCAAHVRFKNRFAYACVDVWKKDSFDGVGLPTWTVSLTPKWGGSPLQPSDTFGDGWIRFKVPAGDYVVSETPQSGWHAIGSSSFDVTLQASGTCGVVTFCNLQDNMQLPANSVCNAGLSGDIKTYTVIQPTPVPTQAPTTSFIAPTNGCRQTYAVRSGDTFFGIATRYGLTINQMAQVNPSINPSFIYPNLSLCIP